MQALRCLSGGGIKIRYLSLETFRGYSRKVLCMQCRGFGPKVLWLLGERPAGPSGDGVMLVLVLPLALLANPLSCVQAPGAERGVLGALLLGSLA